jgi:tetratricopeptide (TPR) repeat protein
LSWKQDVLPLIPFFVAGVGAGLFTAWVEWAFVGASGSEYNFSLIERTLIAGRVIWFYLGKLICPVDLIFMYPRWHVSQVTGWQYLFPAMALLVTLGLWLLSRRNRGPLAAWLFFVGTLFPALGFFNVYPFRFSFVADHFQYLAMIGPLTLAVAGIDKLFRYLRSKERLWELVFCETLLLILGGLTWYQCGMYADGETLWRATLARNPDCWMACNNLGFILTQKGEVEEAMAQFQKALQLHPDYAQAHNNVGTALLQQGKVDEAMAQYQEALESDPDNAETRYNLGNALLQQGNVDGAIAQYQKALQVNPDYAEAHNNLGNALFKYGDVDGAIAQYQKALRINPDYAEACYNLGDIFHQTGRTEEAIAYYQRALQINPDYVEVQNNLARLLATCPEASLRNGNQAVELAQRANQLTGDANPVVLSTLAAAYAEAGRFPDAVKTAQRALELAKAQSDTALAEAIRSQLKSYQAGRPFHSH